TESEAAPPGGPERGFRPQPAAALVPPAVGSACALQDATYGELRRFWSEMEERARGWLALAAAQRSPLPRDFVRPPRAAAASAVTAARPVSWTSAARRCRTA